MKKDNTLRKNWEFQKIINNKKQIVSEDLILYYMKNDKNLRVGISISKKFANAVNRNRNKRQVRNALDLINIWDLKYDVIIILRKNFLLLDFQSKVKKIKEMFERL